MDRRGFLARVAAFVPATAFLARIRFKSIVRVTVNHDDDKPIDFTIVGLISISGLPTEYTAASPFRAKTPFAFNSFPGANPTIMQAAGEAKLRVVADCDETKQHLIAKAPRVTVRMHQPEKLLVEIVGEPKAAP
jgi:hypothetical protein